MFEFSKAKLSITDIWGKAFSLYKASIGKVWYLSLILIIPQLIVDTIKFFTHNHNTIASQLTQNLAATYNWHASDAAAIVTTAIFGLLVTLAPILFILLTIFFIIKLLMYYRMYYQTDETLSGYKPAIRDILFKKLPAYFFTQFTYFLIILYSAIILALLIGLTIGLIGSLIGIGKTGGTATPQLAGFIAMAISIIFYIFIAFNRAAVLFDNANWISALKQSIQLVWGNWWRTFVVFFIPTLIFYAPFLILFFVMAYLKIWIVQDVLIIIAALVFPFFIGLYLIQYNDLKNRRTEKLQPAIEQPTA